MTSKEEIIKTCFDLFKEKGYDNVSIDLICKTCKINKTTFYKLIESKENILKYYYEFIFFQLKEIIQTHEENLDLLYFILLFPVEKNIELGPELYSKYIIQHLHGQTLSTNLKEPIQTLSTQIIKKAQQTGQIKNQSNPSYLFDACRNLTGSYAMLWCCQNGNFDLMDTCQQAIYHIFNCE